MDRVCLLEFEHGVVGDKKAECRGRWCASAKWEGRQTWRRQHFCVWWMWGGSEMMVVENETLTGRGCGNKRWLMSLVFQLCSFSELLRFGDTCDSINILGWIFIFLPKTLLGFWYRVHWIYCSLWEVLPSFQ